jgi:hypothetical protein
MQLNCAAQRDPPSSDASWDNATTWGENTLEWKA